MMQTRFAEIVFRGRNRNSGDAYNLRLSVADPDHLANAPAEQGPGQRRDMGDRPLPRIGFVLADDSKGLPPVVLADDRHGMAEANEGIV